MRNPKPTKEESKRIKKEIKELSKLHNQLTKEGK
jgi:hypothetical protein